MKRLICAFLLFGSSAQALTLDLPGRLQQKLERGKAVGSVLFPTAVWNGEFVPGTTVTGEVTSRVYQSEITDPPEAIMVSISEQLAKAGYTVDLACIAKTCGGFDFRFALPVLPPPEMFVDLGDYAFVSATKDGNFGLMMIASQSPNRAHVQITEVSPPGNKTTSVKSSAPISKAKTQITGDLAKSLEDNGFFILSDLEFKVGSSSLDGTDFKSLSRLADYLSANPHRTIALVGHTDATGSLDGNIALSKKRARAVRTLLLDRYGISGERVGAEGMGYLAPVGPNTTDVGREQNRRVEVIITSAE